MLRVLRSTCVCMTLFVLGLSPGAWAQGASGTITGTVSDETGAVLPGATVTVKNEDTGVTRELVSGEGGHFRATDLPPGPYAVTATLTGFGTLARRGIVLTVGREAVVDLSLKVGGIKDVIT